MAQDIIGSSLRRIRNEVKNDGKQIPSQYNGPNSRIEMHIQRPSIEDRLGSKSIRSRGTHSTHARSNNVFRGRSKILGEERSFHQNKSHVLAGGHLPYNNTSGKAYPVPMQVHERQCGSKDSSKNCKTCCSTATIIIR